MGEHVNRDVSGNLSGDLSSPAAVGRFPERRPWHHPSRWWGLLVHAVVFEVRLYRSLGRWVLRRPAVPPGARAATYHRSNAPVVWLWIFASAVELPLVHVLVPWEGPRLALLVLGVWGLVWMLGFLAATVVHPHLLTDEGIVVRSGAAHRVPLPWSAVAAVAFRREDLASTVWQLQPAEAPAGTDLNVGAGVVNVHLTLRGPTVVPTVRGPIEVVELSFFADEGRDVVALVRAHLAAAAR